MTRWTSRAWKRNAIRPPARLARSPRAGPSSPPQCPLVEAQLVRHGIGASLVRLDATGRREVLGLLVAEIGLGRLEVRPVGLRLEAVVGSTETRSSAMPSRPASRSNRWMTARTPRSRPRRTGGAGFALPRRRCTRPASTCWRTRARPRSRGRARSDTRRPSPSRPARTLSTSLLERELGRVDADHDQPQSAYFSAHARR